MCSPCLITTVVWTVLIICKKPYELNEGNFTNMKEEKLDSVNNKLWYKEIFHISKSFYENRNFTNGICHTDCGPAPEIYNAKKHVTNSIFINSSFSLELSVNYTCNDDLVLIPPDWSNWSCIQDKNRTNSIEPRCLKSCQSPPLLKYGNFSIATAVYESMYLSGTIVEYTCKTGYFLYPPESSIISCDSKGYWNRTIGSCKSNCSILPEIVCATKTVYEVVIVDSVRYEQHVVFERNSSFEMYPANVSNWICVDGSWQPPIIPVCLIKYSDLFYASCTFDDGTCNWISEIEGQWSLTKLTYDLNAQSAGFDDVNRFAKLVVDGVDYAKIKPYSTGHNIVVIKNDNISSSLFETFRLSYEVDLMTEILKDNSNYGYIIMIAVGDAHEPTYLTHLYYELMKMLGGGGDECPISIGWRDSFAMITKKVRYSFQKPDWFSCSHKPQYEGYVDISSAVSVGYMSFKRENPSLLTTPQRLILNHYIEPTSKYGFCLAFNYRYTGLGAYLTVITEDIYGNEIPLWMKPIDLLDTWLHDEINYTNTEDIFRLAFKADYEKEWTGELFVDSIYFTIGDCNALEPYEIFLQNCEFDTDMCNWESDDEDVWTRGFPTFEISVTSEGTISSSRASILINGIEYCGNYRGHNIVYIKPDQTESGSRTFNTYDYSVQVQSMVNFLKELPYGSLIMIALKEFTKYDHLNDNAEYKEVFTSLGVGSSDCPLLINYEYRWLLITKKVRTLAELPDWFRCQSLYIKDGTTSLGSLSITSTTTAYLDDAYICFHGSLVPPLTESRFSINKYFLPLEEGGFCMKFRYQAHGIIGKLSLIAKGGMSGIEKELWVSNWARYWRFDQISYTDTEDSYQLSFKVVTRWTYTGTIFLDKITFTRGVC